METRCRACKSILTGWLDGMIVCPTCWDYIRTSPQWGRCLLKFLEIGDLFEYEFNEFKKR